MSIYSFGCVYRVVWTMSSDDWQFEESQIGTGR